MNNILPFRPLLNGNQLRELRHLKWLSSHAENYMIPQGWTKSVLNTRKQLVELGFLEVIEPNATFHHYRLTKKGVDFRG